MFFDKITRIIFAGAVFLCAMTMPVMAVDADSREEQEQFVPIDLLCPVNKGNGTLELLEKNRLGETSRLRITYKSSRATIIDSTAAPKTQVLYALNMSI